MPRSTIQHTFTLQLFPPNSLSRKSVFARSFHGVPTTPHTCTVTRANLGQIAVAIEGVHGCWLLRGFGREGHLIGIVFALLQDDHVDEQHHLSRGFGEWAVYGNHVDKESLRQN
jgi:hypothetical protein